MLFEVRHTQRKALKVLNWIIITIRVFNQLNFSDGEEGWRDHVRYSLFFTVSDISSLVSWLYIDKENILIGICYSSNNSVSTAHEIIPKALFRTRDLIVLGTVQKTEQNTALALKNWTYFKTWGRKDRDGDRAKNRSVPWVVMWTDWCVWDCLWKQVSKQISQKLPNSASAGSFQEAQQERGLQKKQFLRKHGRVVLSKTVGVGGWKSEGQETGS